MVSKRCKARAVKVAFAAAGIAGVAWAIACLYRSGRPSVPPDVAAVAQADERTVTLGDTPLVSELRSTDDARSGPVPPVLFGIGRPDTDDAPDLSTPAQAVHSVLELLDRGGAGALSQCFCEGAPEANKSLYPRCLGPPVELVDVRRRNAKMLDSRRTGVCEGLPSSRNGQIGDQTPWNRGPDSGIAACVACRSGDYGAKWPIPGHLKELAHDA
mgnify:CR=1 FL=1